MRRSYRRQRGAILMIGLIMLVLITLMALSSFNLGRSNLLIVGNMQNRMQNMEAAKATIEQVISSTNFSSAPSAAMASSCGTNVQCFDVNGDGKNDITVNLAPVPCVKKSQIIKTAQLDFTKPDDAGCLVGASQTLGIAGAATGNSLCADTIWELTAVATDAVTQASYTAVQGVSIRVAADSGVNPAFHCP